MHLLLVTIACLALSSHGTSYNGFFDEQVEYNPCEADSGVFYHADPADAHRYYQCDASGNAYLRSCGSLVWDAAITACNWPTVVQTRSSTRVPDSTTTTTTAEPEPEPEPVPEPEPQPSSSTPSASLCEPVNPCGEHGQCVESDTAARVTRKRFACICDDNWFGRLCDRQTDELTTPAQQLSLDQVQNNAQAAVTFSLPVFNENDAKSIFYGLQGGKTAEDVNGVQERMLDPKEKSDPDEPVVADKPAN